MSASVTAPAPAPAPAPEPEPVPAALTPAAADVNAVALVPAATIMSIPLPAPPMSAGPVPTCLLAPPVPVSTARPTGITGMCPAMAPAALPHQASCAGAKGMDVPTVNVMTDLDRVSPQPLPTYQCLPAGTAHPPFPQATPPDCFPDCYRDTSTVTTSSTCCSDGCTGSSKHIHDHGHHSHAGCAGNQIGGHLAGAVHHDSGNCDRSQHHMADPSLIEAACDGDGCLGGSCCDSSYQQQVTVPSLNSAASHILSLDPESSGSETKGPTLDGPTRKRGRGGGRVGRAVGKGGRAHRGGGVRACGQGIGQGNGGNGKRRQGAPDFPAESAPSATSSGPTLEGPVHQRGRG
eukprot:6206790-Pleurochrysis_carterae.AAC.1